MFASLLRACLKDLLSVARSADFFSRTSTQRVKAAANLGAAYPEALRVYLTTVSAEVFQQDVEALLPLLANGTALRGFGMREDRVLGAKREFHLAEGLAREPVGSRAPLPSDAFLQDLEGYLRSFLEQETPRVKNGCAQAVAVALREEIAEAMDHGGNGSMPDTELGLLLESWDARGVSAEAEEEISRVLEQEFGILPILVQTATTLLPPLRQEMRATLFRVHGAVFIRFRVEPSVFGGMRVFVRGELQDLTWVTRVTQVLQA